MITASRRARRAPTAPKRLSLRSWKDGYQSTKDSNRTGAQGLDASLNQILKQDGTVGDRPSTILYGPQPVGTVLGEIVEFTKRVGTTVTNYLGSIQVVGGVAQFYYAKGEDTTWTLAPGKTFSTTSRVHLCPIRDVDSTYNDEDKVLITNSSDFLAYLDINTMIVIPFTALAATTAPSLTVGAALVGTNFTHRYRVTAGNRGETAASIANTAQTVKMRSEWAGATEYLDITITRITGAKKYHIYYGTEVGTEVYIGSVDDPGSGATVTWRDSGVFDPNIYRPAPNGDTTAGPVCTRASFINGQVFLTGDKTNPKYTRYGGTGLSILDFSPYGGGGFQPVGGNKEIPVKVAAFRNNGGNPAITVLCKGTNGFGKRYIFTPRTLGNVAYFEVSEENGNDGTEAPDSVILAHDQLWYLSRDGGKTTLTEAQVQTILSTKSITGNIQPDVSKWNTASLDYSWGLHFEGRNYWGVASGSTKNNQIIVLDLNDMRRGAWMLPWTIAADWGWLYNDNSGRTHFCVLVNNQILEFTDTVATQDNGVAFPTSGRTGILGFSEDLQEWAIVHRVIYVVQRPQGTIAVSVKGKTEDTPLDVVGSEPFTANTDIVGWSEPVTGGWSSPTRGWSGIERVPQQYGIERTEIVIDDIDTEMNWFYCEWGTTLANCSYEITDIIIEYTPTGTKD
jgi:hypothetical protein